MSARCGHIHDRPPANHAPKGRSARPHIHRGHARHFGASATVRDELAVTGQPLLSAPGEILVTANRQRGLH